MKGICPFHSGPRDAKIENDANLARAGVSSETLSVELVKIRSLIASPKEIELYLLSKEFQSLHVKKRMYILFLSLFEIFFDTYRPQVLVASEVSEEGRIEFMYALFGGPNIQHFGEIEHIDAIKFIHMCHDCIEKSPLKYSLIHLLKAFFETSFHTSESTYFHTKSAVADIFGKNLTPEYYNPKAYVLGMFVAECISGHGTLIKVMSEVFEAIQREKEVLLSYLASHERNDPYLVATFLERVAYYTYLFTIKPHLHMHLVQITTHNEIPHTPDYITVETSIGVVIALKGFHKNIDGLDDPKCSFSSTDNGAFLHLKSAQRLKMSGNDTFGVDVKYGCPLLYSPALLEIVKHMIHNRYMGGFFDFTKKSI